MSAPLDAAREDLVPTSADLGAAAPPWGSDAVTVRMGSIAIVLGGLDARLHALALRNYAGFVEDGAAAGPRESEALPTRIEVRRSPVARYLDLGRGRGPAEEARVDTRGSANHLEMWSYFFAGRFDREATSGTVLLCAAGEHDTSQALENYLRFLVSTAALARGGFLLHSSGIVRDGRAHLFFGPSGAGKSTSVANSPPDWPRLGDDLVLVLPGTGGDGSFRACGVPFRGSFEGAAPNDPGGAPLALACRLFQSRDNRLETVRASVQVAELLGEMPFLMDDALLRTRAAETVERFVRAVPVKRLYLRRDGTFWDVLPR